MIRFCLLVFVVCALPWQALLALSCDERIATPASEENIAFGQGLLWRVESAAAAPNYVFGTIHLSDPRVTQLPDAVTTALEGSDRFGMEVVLDERALAAMAQAMYYSAGARLDETLEPELFARTAQLLALHGVPLSLARRLKPWAAYTTLSVPRQTEALPLDMLLLRGAQSANKSSFGLETIEEQIGLFADMEFAEQRELLRESVCHYEVLQDEVEQMIEVYLARDLDAMMRLALRYRSPLKDRFLETLLTERNARMVERMRDALDRGGTFIAIGALHLPGETGVLSLLRGAGYSLKREY